MEKNDEELKFKVLLLGNSEVGKTSMLKRFCDDTFEQDSLSTIGIDARTKLINHNNKKIKLDIWDTAGQERFLSITKNTYKGSDGIILIYDLTNKESFKNINTWLKGISENIDINKTCFVLVGNKCDCDDLRQVSLEEGQNLAEEKGFPFFETSVKNNININQSFVAIINQMIKMGMGKKKEQGNHLKNGNKKKNNCCLDKKS